VVPLADSCAAKMFLNPTRGNVIGSTLQFAQRSPSSSAFNATHPGSRLLTPLQATLTFKHRHFRNTMSPTSKTRSVPERPFSWVHAFHDPAGLPTISDQRVPSPLRGRVRAGWALTMGARQISSAPSFGREGWDEGEQLPAPRRHNLIRQKKSFMGPSTIVHRICTGEIPDFPLT
jgi:hypothetical protein